MTDDNNNAAFFAALTPERKKLYWRSIKRGVKEADLIFSAFARRRLHELTPAELAEYQILVETPDAELMPMITGAAPTPPDYDTAIFKELKAYQPPLR